MFEIQVTFVGHHKKLGAAVSDEVQATLIFIDKLEKLIEESPSIAGIRGYEISGDVEPLHLDEFGKPSTVHVRD